MIVPTSKYVNDSDRTGSETVHESLWMTVVNEACFAILAFSRTMFSSCETCIMNNIQSLGLQITHFFEQCKSIFVKK